MELTRTIADVIAALAAVSIPVVVVLVGRRISRNASRSEALTTTRLNAYYLLAPSLNRLMCYFTFIGTWKAMTPVEVVALKRQVDEQFYVAAPLFSDRARGDYEEFMGLCFSTWNNWGEDARLRTSAFRRRPVADDWDEKWDRLFVVDDETEISRKDLEAVRAAHDTLVASLIADIDLERPRDAYTTAKVSMNAHAPRYRSVRGSRSEP